MFNSFLGGSVGQESACNAGDPGLIPGLGRSPGGEGMTTHSSVLAWRIPGTGEPGGLLSMGSHRVRHDWTDLACIRALEKEMATHSSVLAWRIPGAEEPGGLLSMGSHRVGHDWSHLPAATERLNLPMLVLLVFITLYHLVMLFMCWISESLKAVSVMKTMGILKIRMSRSVFPE